MKTIAILLFSLLVTLAGVTYAEESAETATKSQAISTISYDADTKALTVVFERGTYVYTDVPADVYEAFKTSESQGTYYRENIKGKYTGTKQGE